MKSYFYSCLFTLLALTAGLSPAHAQAKPSPAKLLAANVPHVAPAVPMTASAAAPLVLAGRVETLAGPLPGAVVRLPRLGQSCVTDAQGNFRFTLPTSTGPEAVVTSYAGLPTPRTPSSQAPRWPWCSCSRRSTFRSPSSSSSRPT